MDSLSFPPSGRDSYSPSLGELLQRAESLLLLNFVHESGNALRTALELALRARCRHYGIWPMRESGAPRTRCDIIQLADALDADGQRRTADTASARRLKRTVDAASHGFSVLREDVREALELAKRLSLGMPLDMTADLEAANVQVMPESVPQEAAPVVKLSAAARPTPTAEMPAAIGLTPDRLLSNAENFLMCGQCFWAGRAAAEAVELWLRAECPGLRNWPRASSIPSPMLVEAIWAAGYMGSDEARDLVDLMSTSAMPRGATDDRRRSIQLIGAAHRLLSGQRRADGRMAA